MSRSCEVCVEQWSTWKLYDNKVWNMFLKWRLGKTDVLLSAR